MVYTKSELDEGLRRVLELGAYSKFSAIPMRQEWIEAGQLLSLDDFEVFTIPANCEDDDEIDSIIRKNIDFKFDMLSVVPGCTSGGQLCVYLYELLRHVQSNK